MPHVSTSLKMSASADQIWAIVKDVQTYPQFMQNVRSVRVAAGATKSLRVSEWSVDLDGSILEWTEIEHIDEAARRITFEQLDGDLQEMRGVWSVVAEPDGGSRAELSVDFEIGIPILADMLNPVAGAALKDNALAMLREIDRLPRD